MTHSTLPATPHWLGSALRFKSHSKECSKAVYGDESNAHIYNKPVKILGKEIPLSSDVLKIAAAMLLWIVGIGIITYLITKKTGVWSKTDNHTNIMTRKHVIDIQEADAALISVAQATAATTAGIPGFQNAQPVRQKPLLSDAQNIVMSIARKAQNPQNISAQELEDLSNIAFDVYSGLKRRELATAGLGPAVPQREENQICEAAQILLDPPFNSPLVMTAITTRMSQLSQDNTLSPALKKTLAESCNRLMYVCQVIKSSPGFSNDTEIADFENNINNAFHGFVNHLPTYSSYQAAGKNQATFGGPGTPCDAGMANNACGSIAIAALLGSATPIDEGYQLHRNVSRIAQVNKIAGLETAARRSHERVITSQQNGDPPATVANLRANEQALRTQLGDERANALAGRAIYNYSSQTELNGIPGVNIGTAKDENPIDAALPLTQRYTNMFSRLARGEQGLLQVSGLFLMCRKNQGGTVDIYDSHGRSSIERPNSAAVFARFTDPQTAALFLAAGRRPNFETAGRDIITFYPVTFDHGITSAGLAQSANAAGGVPPRIPLAAGGVPPRIPLAAGGPAPQAGPGQAYAPPAVAQAVGGAPPRRLVAAGPHAPPRLAAGRHQAIPDEDDDNGNDDNDIVIDQHIAGCWWLTPEEKADAQRRYNMELRQVRAARPAPTFVLPAGHRAPQKPAPVPGPRRAPRQPVVPEQDPEMADLEARLRRLES